MPGCVEFPCRLAAEDLRRGGPVGLFRGMGIHVKDSLDKHQSSRQDVLRETFHSVLHRCRCAMGARLIKHGRSDIAMGLSERQGSRGNGRNEHAAGLVRMAGTGVW